MAAAENEATALPCPQCEYDLRGQTKPRCPECGLTFDSLQSLIRASRGSWRVQQLVMRWRQRVALAFTISLALAYFVFPIGTVAIVLVLAPMLIASGFSVVLLGRVIRWRLNARISPSRRRRLNGSIALLAVFSTPALLVLIVFLAWVLR